MLVDMAGSGNNEAAGQTGFDAKMQTGAEVEAEAEADCRRVQVADLVVLTNAYNYYWLPRA